ILFNQNGKVPEDLFRDRIVLIGAATIDAPDLLSTSFYEPSSLPLLLDRSISSAPARTTGVEIHATTVATMLFGQSPVRPRYLWQVLLLIFPLSLVSFAVFRLRIVWGVLSIVVLAIATLAISSWAFTAHGLILPLATIWIGMILITPAGFGLRYARERGLHAQTAAERAHLRDILS